MGLGPTIQRLMREYKGRVRLVIKQYPYKYRDFAFISSESVLAANEQGKFWQMHELLLKRSPKLDKESLISYAQEIGLDVARFKEALDKKSFAPLVERDLSLARSLDLYNTPTLFINGIKVVGNRPYEYYKKIIEQELKDGKK